MKEQTYRTTIRANGWLNLFMFGQLRRRIRWCLNHLGEDDGIKYQFTESGFWHRDFVVKGSHKDIVVLSRSIIAMGKRGWITGTVLGVEVDAPHVKIERDWVTKAGLRAVVLMSNMGHRCGYVGVERGHPLHGVDYDLPHPALRTPSDDEPVGKRSPIVIMMCALGDRAPTAELAFDVHGGITYSGGGYPLSDGRWYYGFDAAHCDDLPAPGSMMAEFLKPFEGDTRVHRTEEYMASECERLAEQLVGPKVNAVSNVRLFIWCITSRLFRIRKWWGRFNAVCLPYRLRRWPAIARWFRGF